MKLQTTEIGNMVEKHIVQRYPTSRSKPSHLPESVVSFDRLFARPIVLCVREIVLNHRADCCQYKPDQHSQDFYITAGSTEQKRRLAVPHIHTFLCI